MNPSASTVCALAAASLVAAVALFQDHRAAPVWVQSDLEKLAQRVQDEVASLRGQQFHGSVPVKVADKQTLVAYLKQRTEEEDPPEKLAADERVAKLLGVIPPDMDLLATTYDLLEDQVAGFYDPPSKTFYLMDEMPKGFAGPILAHELVHALDDQLYDLDSAMEAVKDDSDASEAFRFVVEGSGTTGGNRWTFAHLGDVSMAGSEGLMQEQMASMAKAPDWLWKPLLGAYMQGAAFLTRSQDVKAGQMLSVENSDLERAFRDRPRSTEQVLHPEKYWNSEQRDEPRLVKFEVGELPEGWSELRSDTLGELGLALVVQGPGKPLDLSNPMAVLEVAYTNEFAEGWGGDRVLLLGNGNQSWLRLATVWDSERDAGEFYAGMHDALPRFEKACRELGSEGASHGVKLAYGQHRDEVVLTLWTGITRPRDRKVIEDGVSYSVAR